MAAARSTVSGMKAGSVFELVNHPKPELDGRYPVLEVTHGFTEGGLAYENQLRCIPEDVPHRPHRSAAKPRIHSVVTATVVGPAGSDLDEDRAALQGERLLQKKLEEKTARELEKGREIIAGFGLDPDEHGPIQPPPVDKAPDDLSRLPEVRSKLEAEAASVKAEQERLAEERLRAVEPDLREAGFDPARLHEELDSPRVGPPSYTGAAQIGSLRRIAESCRAAGTPIAEIEDGYLEDEKFLELLERGEQGLRDAYPGARVVPSQVKVLIMS